MKRGLGEGFKFFQRASGRKRPNPITRINISWDAIGSCLEIPHITKKRTSSKLQRLRKEIENRKQNKKKKKNRGKINIYYHTTARADTGTISPTLSRCVPKLPKNLFDFARLPVNLFFVFFLEPGIHLLLCRFSLLL